MKLRSRAGALTNYRSALVGFAAGMVAYLLVWKVRPPNEESYYWANSSMAQVVATLMGLLIAGYSIWASWLRTKRKEEDSLDLQAVWRIRHKTEFELVRASVVVGTTAIVAGYYSVLGGDGLLPPTAGILVTGVSIGALSQIGWTSIRLLDPGVQEDILEKYIGEVTGVPSPAASSRQVHHEVFVPEGYPDLPHPWTIEAYLREAQALEAQCRKLAYKRGLDQPGRRGAPWKLARLREELAADGAIDHATASALEKVVSKQALFQAVEGMGSDEIRPELYEPVQEARHALEMALVGEQPTAPRARGAE